MPIITDKLVKKIPTPTAPRQVRIYDERLPGFGVRVTASGKKSFILNYTCRGRERRITIGSTSAWSVVAARERAAKLKQAADAGDDPMKERLLDRSRKTIGQLWSRYSDEVLPSKRPKTIETEESMWRRLILPEIGSLFVDDLRSEDVDALHRRVSKCTPVQANRCVSSLRHVFNKAVRWKLIAVNPVVGVQKNVEVPRERYLSEDEKRRFLSALRRRPVDSSSLAITFIMLTGCRKGEAFVATWDEVDLEAGIWTKPSSHTKQKRVHRVPLSSGAREILATARTLGGTNYVFPGANGGHLSDPKKAFRAICHEAGIENFRLHDLRHCFASSLISDGFELTTIGKLLGHTQVSTTLRYSHLADDPLRRAVESISVRMGEGHGKEA